MKFLGGEYKPVIDGLMFNGMKFKAMIDTWQTLPLSLTPAAGRALGLSGFVEKSPPRITTVDSMQIGPLSMSSPETALYGKKTGFDYGLERCGAIIGGGFLKKFKVTFDY